MYLLKILFTFQFLSSSSSPRESPRNPSLALSLLGSSPPSHRTEQRAGKKMTSRRGIFWKKIDQNWSQDIFFGRAEVVVSVYLPQSACRAILRVATHIGILGLPRAHLIPEKNFMENPWWLIAFNEGESYLAEQFRQIAYYLAEHLIQKTYILLNEKFLTLWMQVHR